MKIGDEVYVHGYVDEMRNDVVIIRNDGGYFGTVYHEVVDCEQTEPQTEKPTYHADVICNYKDCDNCGHQSYCPQTERSE